MTWAPRGAKPQPRRSRYPIVGGIRRVVYRSLRSGHPQELREHTEELLDWALGYQRAGERMTAEDRSPSRVRGDSPGWREPPDSPRSRATLSQRERIVRAAALVATEGGYAGLSVGAVSTCAGVSKQTFYEHFPNKQTAFIAAYDAQAERALAIAAAAFATQEDWAEGIRAGIEALLRHIAADRVYARLSFFELPAAGTDALDRGDRAQEGFTAFLDPAAFGASTPLHPPPIVIEAISGGTWAAIQHEITAGREAELPDLAPELAAIVLTPFGLGPACRAAP